MFLNITFVNKKRLNKKSQNIAPLKWLTALSVLAITLPAVAFENFISRDGHRLMDGKREFRFAGIHAPELHRIEDDARGKCPHDTRGWGQYFLWPTPEEQENWIKALTRSGHKATRIYVLSVEQKYDALCERETHILKPLTAGGMPRLNEKAMRVYDRMIAFSDKHGLRLILPIIDGQKWWGGRIELAAFYGEPEFALYDVNSKTYAAYKSIIKQLITRKNTVTGRRYYDEKAILSWETGNELYRTNESFLRQTAAYIRSLDKNHLIADGTFRHINEYALDDDNIDIVSNHFYENISNSNPEQVLADLKAVNGKKAYFVGEFGLKPSDKMDEIMQTIVHGDYNGFRAAGGLVWGFRGHRHGGGFYWHEESNNYFSYHLPGFPDGDSNEEQKVIDLVRKAQAQIAGKTKVPALPAPEAPVLLDIASHKKINWRGAPLGRFYRIERATNKNGPWTTIAKGISDGKNKYDPRVDSLFSDSEALQRGKTYYYRVFAENESGESLASNIVPFHHPAQQLNAKTEQDEE